MAELKDSGNRRQFETGAVRDIAEGKGRCDLLPLIAAANVLCSTEQRCDSILTDIELYMQTGVPRSLLSALDSFTTLAYPDRYTMMLEVSHQYEDGCKKYGERNWEKGIPLHSYIDSAIRHYLKYRRGDKDEPHDRAFVWNILSALWTQQNKPELNDLPFNRKVVDKNV